MKFHIVSIFPKMVEDYVSESILKKAKERKLIDFAFYDIRSFSKDKHGKVDDKPYSGGPGMILTLQPIVDCVTKILENLEKKGIKRSKIKIVNFVPGAETWTNVQAKDYAKKYEHIILICGRYEGIDFRLNKIFKMQNVSVGDFVLTGGEIPAMILVDTISRQIKDVLGDFNSLEEKRDSDEEFYTRPEIFMHKKKKFIVPKVFLSGNPKLIAEYRQENKFKK